VTSTAPGAHPPPEEVDALLDPSGGDARVQAHVAGCSRCGHVREELRAVRALLGRQAGAVPPEPPDLGARIAAALAAEPALRATAPGAGATPVPITSRRRRPATAWLAVAASVAVVGLGGTFLATRLDALGGADAGGAASAESVEDTSGGAQGGAQEGTQGGEGGAAAEPGESSAGGGRDDGSGVVGLPPTSEPDRSPAAAGGDLASGTDYTGGALAVQAGALLEAVQRQQGGAPDLSEHGEGPDRALADEGTRAACLLALGRPGALPVATDLATFEGEPAAVLVLPASRGYDVVVVPDACGSGDDRVLARARLD
jgi:hypothetical protein